MPDISPELFAQRWLTQVTSHSARFNTGVILEMPASTLPVVDATDPTKRVFYNLSGLTTATDRTVIVPNTSGLQVVVQSVRTDGAYSLVDDTSTQPLWTAANDALTVVAGASYRFHALIKLTKGANSVSLNFLFGGSATFTTCNYGYISRAAVSGAAGAANMSNIEVATTSVVQAASTAANVIIQLDGEFEINAGGTIIPSVIWSGATGSTPSVNVGSFFECWMTGANPVTIIGAWA